MNDTNLVYMFVECMYNDTNLVCFVYMFVEYARRPILQAL